MCVKDVGKESNLVIVGKWRYRVAPYRGHLLASDWIIIVHNKLVWETPFIYLFEGILIWPSR